jgi:organic radical activating enzyme
MMAYNYNGREPIKIAVEDLTEPQKNLIFENKTFCLLPWIHLHSFPTGEAYPCCNTEMQHKVGNTNEQSLSDIWYGPAMRDIRDRMLAGEQVSGCSRCYEQEDAGFFSMRLSSNKHFGHHIARCTDNNPDMNLVYWDIRFSNLCNLSCRSCGHIFSSKWYEDQAKLVDAEGQSGDRWKSRHKRINFAGRTENDMWEQLESQIDNLEQVYFAGGEPLIMEEHYRLLHELLKRGRTDVRLIYNTNFTELTYKKTNVLELWKEFESVSIGASLDAMGVRGEYIRKNCNWKQIENNRQKMMEICPKVDFYISPTLSIMNAWHITDFHRDWVAKGFLKPQDLNINILQDPEYYRIDVISPAFKEVIKNKWEEHLEWLRPQDKLTRATTGFESAIKFMMADDKSHLGSKFWDRTNKLDKIRNENLLSAIPELYNEQIMHSTMG